MLRPPRTRAFCSEAHFHTLLDANLTERQRAGDDRLARHTARKQHRGIGLDGALVHRADHPLIAGQFNVAAEQRIGEPQYGVEPVDSQQRETQRLPPVVTPREMRLLMRQYILPLYLIQTGGQIDVWFYNAEDKRRGNGIAKINVILNGGATRSRVGAAEDSLRAHRAAWLQGR